MNASGNIDRFRAIVPLSSATEINQGHDKRGEIWMSLITCGSIHEGHEWFSDYSRGRQEIFICLAVLFSLRKQPPFFAPGPSGVSRNATRARSEKGRLFSQAMFYHVSNLPIRERRCQLRYRSSPTS